MNSPEEDRVRVEHKEFRLVITSHDWRLPDKYDILLDKRVLEPMRHKLWFDLRPPSEVKDGDDA